MKRQLTHTVANVLATFVGLIFLSSLVLADDGIEPGQLKAQVCTLCHGVDGNSSSSLWPSLAGQDKKYLTQQLNEYRKGSEGARRNYQSTTMYTISETLSAQDIEDIASFFSQQTLNIIKPKKETVDSPKYEQGESLYTGSAGCVACHGDKGRGILALTSPSIAGQSTYYTITQLTAFKNGERTDSAGLMGNMTSRLSEDEIATIALYLRYVRE